MDTCVVISYLSLSSNTTLFISWLRLFQLCLSGTLSGWPLCSFDMPQHFGWLCTSFLSGTTRCARLICVLPVLATELAVTTKSSRKWYLGTKIWHWVCYLVYCTCISFMYLHFCFLYSYRSLWSLSQFWDYSKILQRPYSLCSSYWEVIFKILFYSLWVQILLTFCLRWHQ